MNKNKVVCDAESGICEIQPPVSKQPKPVIKASGAKPLRIIYYTDPICSACWAVEGILHRLQFEYGHLFTFDMHMGGLMPTFEVEDKGQAQEMAALWDKAGAKYGVPVNGAVWLKHPLRSSFPPSIACKAAELQGIAYSDALLRRLRELLFVAGKDISDEAQIRSAVAEVGLDVRQWELDYKTEGRQRFDADIELGISLGVWGFPTLYFFDAEGNQQELFGVFPYERFEEILRSMVPHADKRAYDATPQALMNKLKSLTVKELMILADMTQEQAHQALVKLAEQPNIEELASPNGSVWRLRS